MKNIFGACLIRATGTMKTLDLPLTKVAIRHKGETIVRQMWKTLSMVNCRKLVGNLWCALWIKLIMKTIMADVMTSPRRYVLMFLISLDAWM